MDIVLEKPWRNLKRYIEGRREEALAEAKVALSLLENGFVKNAAGKAFQAFKSLLASLAAENREKLAGMRGLGKIIAFMPTRSIREVPRLLGLGREAIVALSLHQFQYNGPDPEGVMSIYPDLDSACRDICWLLRRVFEELGAEMPKSEAC